MLHIKFDKNEVFFAGCLHFGHLNICRSTSSWSRGHRDFDSIKEMNDCIINNINTRTTNNSHLFVLGDMFFGQDKHISIPQILKELKCKVHYIFGNHCDYLRNHEEYWPLFSSVSEYKEIVVGKQLICLFHYPCEVWRDSHKGSWMLHSHCHATLEENNNIGNRLEVGTDCSYYIKDNVLYKADSHGEVHKISGNFVVDNSYELKHASFNPFSFHEIKHLMTFKKNRFVDHHNKDTN